MLLRLHPEDGLGLRHDPACGTAPSGRIMGEASTPGSRTTSCSTRPARPAPWFRPCPPEGLRDARPLAIESRSLVMGLHGRGLAHSATALWVRRFASRLRGLHGPAALRGLRIPAPTSSASHPRWASGCTTTWPWTRGAGASSYRSLGSSRVTSRLRDLQGPAAPRGSGSTEAIFGPVLQAVSLMFHRWAIESPS